MYLKALRLVGFKSFAETAELSLSRGVTAIVGPNGSGKSNLLDAIRWALGEQSARTLRAGQMQDLLFGGSETRLPLGLAEVSLHFADCERLLPLPSDEITVTRRLYRDGKSEYEINGTPARLRDLHDLFRNTGSACSAYSFFEQGRIDQVLSAHPEDRRILFEEAAGIAKFQAERREAVRRLDAARENLLRLDDILRELDRQLVTLQRQATRVRRRQELSERLRNVHRELYARRFREVRLRCEDFEAEQSLLEREGKAVARRLAAGERALQGVRAARQAEEARVSLVQQEKAERIRSHDLACERSRMAEERLAELARRQAEHQGEIDWMASSLQELGSEIRTGEEGSARMLREMEELQKQAEEIRSRIALGESNRRAKALRVAERERRQKHLLHEQAVAREALLTLQAASEERCRRAAFLRDQRDQEIRLRSDLDRQCRKAEEERKQADQKEKAAQVELLLQQETVAAAARELSRIEEALLLAEAEEAKLSARRDALVEMAAEKSDASGKMSHLFEEARRRGLAIIGKGVLLDQMRVTPGYEAAISALLGTRLTACLLQDRGEAQALSRLWETSETSSCVLASIPPKPQAAQTRFRPPCALAFVKADPWVWPLLESLLSHAIVVESIDEAFAAGTTAAGTRIATRSGIVVADDGFLDCGSLRPEPAAILRIRNEQEEIETALSAARKRHSIILEEWRKIRQGTEEERARRNQLEEKRRLLEIERWKKEESKANFLDRLAQASESLLRLDSEVADIARRESETREGERSRQEAIARIGKDLLDLEQEGGEEECTLSLLDREASELSQASAILAERLQRSRSGFRELSSQVEALKRRARETRQRLSESKASRERSMDEARSIRAEGERSRREEESLKISLDELDKDWREASTACRRLAAEEAEEEARVNEERSRSSRIERRLGSIAVEMASLHPEKLHLAKAAHEACGIDLEAVERTLMLDEVSACAAEEEAQRLRSQLEAIGSVDAEAVEAVAREEKRREDLEAQKRDLLAAQKELVDSLAEMEAHACGRFLQTFASIQEHLQDCFHHLFQGGKAALSLQGDDPLSAGIDIAAQPPGKRLRNLSLLSGGERTLTALALLFALYRVKPSPFCILDEMDAPLDEASLRSFLSLIFHFRSSSQFLIITHNRHTVAAADQVYGVTMPEQGASRIYSLRYPSEPPRKGREKSEGGEPRSSAPAFL